MINKSGVFSLITINDKESDLFLEFLRKSSNTCAYDFVKYLLGDDYLKFIDLLAGTVLKIPSHKNLLRDLECIKLYRYVRDHGYTEESIKNAARIFNKKISYVRRAVKRVSLVVEGKEVEIRE
jgi:hypothetical protein